MQCRLGLTEIKAMILDDFKKEVDEEWRKETRVMKELIPSIRHGKFPLSRKFRNRNRLLLNKPYCMLESGPQCESCKVTVTVEHILIECKKYDSERKKLRSVFAEHSTEFNARNILDTKQCPVLRAPTLCFLNGLENI